MGDTHRIPRATDKKYSDTEFERLLSIEPAKLSRNFSQFYIRPVYQYTKAEVGRVPNLRRANHITDL